jgi:exonuclease III
MHTDNKYVTFLKKKRILLIALTLLPTCTAMTPGTATMETTNTITSMAATAYTKYIASEITEPDIRHTIRPHITGTKPENSSEMLHGWVQNLRGSINNTYKWCGLIDSLTEEEPDYAVITETTKDNDPTDLLFLHRRMYKEDLADTTPPPIGEHLPYNIFSTCTSAPGEKGGVTLLLHKKYQHRMVGKPSHDANGRWISVDIRTPRGRTTLIMAYLPPSPQSSLTARRAWAELQEYIVTRHNKKNRLVVLAGYLNASKCDPLHRKHTNSPQLVAQRRLLSTLMDSAGLTDTFPRCHPDKE